MLQNLLVDRFKPAFHKEARQTNLYTLRVEKGGPKFKEAKDDEQSNIDENPGSTIHVTFRKWPIKGLARSLSGVLGTPVRDETGLTKMYDFTLEWAPDPSADSGPSIFTAVQEQLGLKLEAGKGPVDVMVIDHVDHATQN